MAAVWYNDYLMNIEHPGIALLIVFGVALLLEMYGLNGTVKLLFLIVASFFIYKALTARRAS